MEISPIAPLLVGSKFEERATEVADTFSQAGITTLEQLDNAPRLLGPKTAGYSTFGLIAYVREAAIARVIAGDVIEELAPEPEPAEVEPEKKPAPKKKIRSKQNG